ncbi:MAG: putative glycoside hydrolase [Limnohabitans sp.]
MSRSRLRNGDAAIGGFLSQARARLAPFNVGLASDVLGCADWNHNDTQIGLRLQTWVDVLDYDCPMLSA